MQPSTFRFSCMLVSRVECMLQLPSLDIVFSSKRVEEELTEFREFKTTTVQSTCKDRFGNRWSIRHGFLADFFVYIYHPYGGGKKSGLKESQWPPLSDSERKVTEGRRYQLRCYQIFHHNRYRLSIVQERHAIDRNFGISKGLVSS